MREKVWLDIVCSLWGEETPLDQVERDLDDPTFRRGFQTGLGIAVAGEILKALERAGGTDASC